MEQAQENSVSSVPGQGVLPGMVAELGYEVIELKPSLERFCWEFVLRNDNPTDAYILAIKPESTREQARKNAHKLLQKEDVRRRIDQIKQELKQRYAITAEDLIQYHGKVLKISRDEFLDRDTGKPRAVADISPEALSILEFDAEKDSKGNVHVLFKVPQRHQSAVELARIMGMHKDKVELTGKDGKPIETSSSVTIYIPSNGRD